MLVLYETAAGYALFKLVDDGKMEKPEEIYKDFESVEKANQAYVFCDLEIFFFDIWQLTLFFSPIT